jgi:hypothetical protein
MRDDKDRGSKRLIEHQGNAILLLAGITGVRSWRPAAAELVAPRQLPDGLLEVTFEGQQQPDLFLLEIATYPERRTDRQARDDVLLVLLDRGVLPEMLTVVLRQKGQLTVSGEAEQTSRLGFTRVGFKSEVLELWTVQAERLLAAGDVGVVPWLLLTAFEGPPEEMARLCRERIDRDAKEGERASLLAVTRILARLRYNDPGLLDLLITRDAMIESPELQEILQEKAEETRRQTLREALQGNALRELESRFGPVPADVAVQVRAVADEERMYAVLRQAILCADLAAFRAFLVS